MAVAQLYVGVVHGVVGDEFHLRDVWCVVSLQDFFASDFL